MGIPAPILLADGDIAQVIGMLVVAFATVAANVLGKKKAAKKKAEQRPPVARRPVLPTVPERPTRSRPAGAPVKDLRVPVREIEPPRRQVVAPPIPRGAEVVVIERRDGAAGPLARPTPVARARAAPSTPRIRRAPSSRRDVAPTKAPPPRKRSWLASREGLRKAIIAAEVLGKPVALRDQPTLFD